ncbi:LysR substrate-binding domain-containing protein [Roseobacter sp. A03A-229]
MRQLNRIPLSSLRAVEAIGRIGTLAGAAEELGVTQGAVSQRLAKAERDLGLRLFHRRPAGLSPTEACAQILPRLTLGMESLAAAVDQMSAHNRQSLVVSVAPIFASRWLIWRIRDFHEQEPSISIRVEPRAEVVDFRSSEVDVGLRVGLAPGEGVRASKLLDQRVFPVCSPELAARIETLDDLLACPIIRENEDLFGWDIWLKDKHVTLPEDAPGPTYADASLCLDAALTDQGVFMAWETLACDMLAMGRLVAPFADRRETGQAYWFVSNGTTPLREPVRKFQDWLERELAQSVSEWQSDSPG